MAPTPDPNDIQISNFLLDYVDGIAPLEALLRQYNLSYDQISDLVDLTDRLGRVLTDVTPSPEFIAALYQDLLHNQPPNHAWWNRVVVPQRVQAMSNRTKLAAGIGGLTLVYLTARSLSYLLNMRHRDEATGEMVA